MANNLLYRVETLVVDGTPVPLEDGTCTLTGMAGFENGVVPSSKGDDYVLRKRVPRGVSCKLQFTGEVPPTQWAALSGVQITARAQQGGRRVLLTNCSFAALGAIGQGTVDISFHVLAEPQWL